MKEKIFIDILIGVAAKGGVENVVRKLVSYLPQQDYQVRVVQLVWEGYRWLDSSADFWPLLEGRSGHTVQEFEEVYRDFLSRSPRKPDLILGTAWPLTVLIAKYACASCGIEAKIISWLHNPIEQYAASGFGNMECLKLADAHFAISAAIANSIRASYPNSAVYQVKNPVDTASLPFRAEHTPNTLAFAGRLSFVKRLDVVFQAIAAAKSYWELTIVGEGEEKENLKALAASLEITRQIHWAGWQENPWDICCHASFAVLASIHEGFPLMAIEAAACGIPTISTPVSGCIEFIKPGINGYLFPQGEALELAQILDYIEEKKLPYPDPYICRERASDYESERALSDFTEKLHMVLAGVLLP